MMLQTL